MTLTLPSCLSSWRYYSERLCVGGVCPNIKVAQYTDRSVFCNTTARGKKLEEEHKFLPALSIGHRHFISLTWASHAFITVSINCDHFHFKRQVEHHKPQYLQKRETETLSSLILVFNTSGYRLKHNGSHWILSWFAFIDQPLKTIGKIHFKRRQYLYVAVMIKEHWGKKLFSFACLFSLSLRSSPVIFSDIP